MVETSRGVEQCCPNVIDLEVWQFFDYLCWELPCRKQFKDIHNTNAHPADTGSTATLLWINGDSFE